MALASSRGMPDSWLKVFGRVLFGLSVAFLLHMAAEYANVHWGWRSLNDWAGDFYVSLFEDQARHGENPVPFLFIDIDDETHERWGHPPATPRDRLDKLIEFARRSCAALIFVDVDLSSRRSYGALLPEGDSRVALVEALEAQDEALKDSLLAPVPCNDPIRAGREDLPGTPVLLHREFETRIGASPDQILSVRPSVLDEAVEKTDVGQDPHLAWVATVYEQSPDGVVRQWRLAQEATVEAQKKGEKKRQEIRVPSVQLYSCAFIRDRQDVLNAANDKETRSKAASNEDAKNNSERFERLQSLMAGHKPVVDAHNSLTAGRKALKHDCGWDPTYHDSHDTRRFLYVISWNPEEPSLFGGPEIPWKGKTVHLFTRLPAISVLDQMNKDESYTALDLVADKIVIIGGSYSESRDYYRTPVGHMPGAVVIANATHSLLNYKPLKSIYGWEAVLLAVILVVLFAIAQGLVGRFVSAHTLAVTLGIAAVLSIAAITISILYYVSAIWVNIVAAICAMHWEYRLESIGVLPWLRKKLLGKSSGH